MDIGPPEWISIGIVLLLVFGSGKLPQLARNLGRAQSELKKGLADARGEQAADEPRLERDSDQDRASEDQTA